MAELTTSEYHQLEQEYPSAPPPEYGSALAEDGRPPPYNPRSNSLRNALQAMEEFFLSQEQLPDHQRTGTLRPRNDFNNYIPVVDEDTVVTEDVPTRNRGRERARRHAREFANTLTLRGNRQRHRNRNNEREPTREEVMETLPTFWPICTLLITAIQIALFVAVCIWYGLAPISFISITETSRPLPVFAGPDQPVTKEVPPNFFIGPNVGALVHVGAQYTPCMRDNVEFRIKAAIRRNNELNLRCCIADGCGYGNICGMITLSSCLESVNDRGDCKQVLGGASVCRNESVYPMECSNVTLHPCCIGTLGDCVITTEQNCSFQNGYFHPDKAVCSDVGEGCFDDICSFFWSTWLDNVQWLRFVFAIFLHRGVVDLLLLMLAQLYISWRIERRIGWLRVFLIYIISGVGGFLLSGIFIPDTVSVGASGSLFGLLAVQLVELLQGWKWVKKPWLELVKLLLFYIILLVLGTLPYIDNYANIGGFIFGLFSAFIFVPYISVGKWDRVKKLTLILIALPVVMFMFLVGFVFFYNLPNPNFCSWCTYINCIPYTPTFCDDFLGNIQKIIPTIPVK